MYFAVEPSEPDLPARLAALLDEASTRCTAFHVHALVDAAFDEALPTSRPWSPDAPLSLYRGTPLQPLEPAAPYLLSAPPSAQARGRWLQRLFAACAGRPMLSVLACAVTADRLALHLRPYLVARTPDGLRWPVRWADTRVLPGLIDALTPAQRQHLLAPLHGWHAPGRRGEHLQWSGSGCAEAPPAAFEHWPIDEAGFAVLVDRAEADAVLAELHASAPVLVGRFRPADAHARVAQKLALASRHGIESAGARRHFAQLALILAADFTAHPAMASLLERTAQGAAYPDEIGKLPDVFWQDTALT